MKKHIIISIAALCLMSFGLQAMTAGNQAQQSTARTQTTQQATRSSVATGKFFIRKPAAPKTAPTTATTARPSATSTSTSTARNRFFF